MGIPGPDAGSRSPATGTASGAASGATSGTASDVASSAASDRSGSWTRQLGTVQQVEPGPAEQHAERPSVAAVIVPTLLGLLGFVAVAAAVTADAATVSVTVPGLLLALTALVVAGASPLYAANPTWASLRRPVFLLALCLVAEAALFLFAPQLILFSVPALPLALGGGAVLMSTSLWGQFRKGPVPEPVLLPRREAAARPFASTLLVVAVNWALFLAAGAFCAWLLLGD